MELVFWYTLGNNGIPHNSSEKCFLCVLSFGSTISLDRVRCHRGIL